MAGAVGAYKEYLSHSANKAKNEGLYSQAKIIALQLQKNPRDDSAKKDLTKLANTLRAPGSLAAPGARKVVASILFKE
ncbi:MAG: hypothetical protein NTV34_09485, partial [Proteobacteria bacterium]|nr:hypothetical protein [Pseudomonadota bacterium]